MAFCVHYEEMDVSCDANGDSLKFCIFRQPRAGEILLDIAKQAGVTEEERKDNLENNLRSLLKRKRDIVERCEGIPLAIVVIAGMLRARERT
ncbi:hypothetical protein RDI58_020147 [Solanum bulbocastanum]|uniref:Uncharacterized protein n=1 Tax=Solanum bulbocastanum TaxID=147425 RepID=A0AAN8Y8A8_SOLBU